MHHDDESLLQVPRSKKINRHHISGEGRVNLTFRRLKPEWAVRAPQCRCNQRSVMRCSMRSERQKRQRSQQSGDHAVQARADLDTRDADDSSMQPQYYYACDNTHGPGCGFWQAVPLPNGSANK